TGLIFRMHPADANEPRPSAPVVTRPPGPRACAPRYTVYCRQPRHQLPLLMSAAAPASQTYIIGHRNPDADAICSAIAYAALKAAQGHTGFVAARCGNSNARIDTILARFHQPLPTYVSDVTPRVRDVMVQNVVSVPQNATCAEALELIDRHDVRGLPVVGPEKELHGINSMFHLGGFFIPKVHEPREMRRVFSSLSNIARALKGRTLNLERPDEEEELFVRVGAMDVRSFWKISQ